MLERIKNSFEHLFVLNHLGLLLRIWRLLRDVAGEVRPLNSEAEKLARPRPAESAACSGNKPVSV